MKERTEAFRRKVFSVIESSDSGDGAGRAFDLALITLIVLNLCLVVLETFSISEGLRAALDIADLITVIIFTAEYFLRLWTADLLYPALGPAKARLKYAFSFLALVDLLAILPFYLPFVIIDLRVLQTLRFARLLRLFKAKRYTSAFDAIGVVLRKRVGQLMSSTLMVVLLMVVTSVLMYQVENPAQPDKFEDAFSSLWWAISTVTTVGYGDIVPITMAGQILNAVFALLGIGLVAIPTGIISAGFVDYYNNEREKQGEDSGEKSTEKCYCSYCGHKLDEREESS